MMVFQSNESGMEGDWFWSGIEKVIIPVFLLNLSLVRGDWFKHLPLLKTAKRGVFPLRQY